MGGLQSPQFLRPSERTFGEGVRHREEVRSCLESDFEEGRCAAVNPQPAARTVASLCITPGSNQWQSGGGVASDYEWHRSGIRSNNRVNDQNYHSTMINSTVTTFNNNIQHSTSWIGLASLCTSHKMACPTRWISRRHKIKANPVC